MPKVYNWAAKSTKDEFEGILAQMEFNGPETGAEAIEMFGDEVVLTNFIGNIRVTAQGAMRRMIEKRMKIGEISERMKTWRPGIALSRDIDPEQAFLAKYRSSDPKERKRMLALLKEEAG